MPKLKIIYQRDSRDCGPASLKMITDYYGNNYNLEEIQSLFHIGKSGVALLSISEAAEKIGFKTLGCIIPFKKLVEEVPLPCILHWEQNHFTVLYKVRKRNLLNRNLKLFVADPALGKTIYSEQEFKEKWLSTRMEGTNRGILLMLEPSSRFFYTNKQEKSKSGLKFLISYFARYRKFFVQLILGLIFGCFVQLIFPFLTQLIVDQGIMHKDFRFIYVILFAQMMLILSRASVDFIRSWILLHISTRINISIISDFFIKLMKLPMSYFDSKLTGDILQRIDDHERVEKLITTRSLETLFSLFTLLIFGIVLSQYSIKIFLVFIIGSALYGLWLLLFLRKRRVLDYKLFDISSKEHSMNYQLIQGMQEIKLNDYETIKRWEWEDIKAEMFNLNISILQLNQKQEAGNIVINESKNILITVIAALSVINNEMSMGMMLATQYIIGQLSVPIEQTMNLVNYIQDSKLSLDRINEIHRKDDEDSKELNNSQFEVQDKSIILKDIAFQYQGPKSPYVLKNISISIRQNETTAIVGASGSGKTTLLKLILKYYQPLKGSIHIGSYDLSSISAKKWRKSCGVILQDSFLFSESIARNIALTDREIDKNRLVLAAKTANIHDFIMQLPLKYNTEIGNEGQNLSHGQRQRILIARIIYKNPDFIFLDEATNALDADNEKIIINNLNEFYKGKTAIIVAHRLSTVKNADKIIVLDHGKVVEEGTHYELIKKHGMYYHLVVNQLELGI